ncbi:hypothetical protein L21SP3_01005 [Sedimentisphaera cyanobacteriorum]|uniref:Type II restriction endonuclease subunit R n=1 Tax=Sedimentisphaera cyanobacteriorum TaxID=1940790 RepID=A0A1Q2HPJ8_9BACT|nr:ThaI family type II restriction endonuclease [Sedimentisphaera cyanobacteriorum]AQQ09204.1 hypothetical protein L21SP3_01005 [Sedimentisphaera cyanobacteriorum]
MDDNAVLKSIRADEALVEKIKSKLPAMFHLAELECSSAGKIGMEVGFLRERIIIAMLIYKFGRDNVKTDIPITQKEVDVEVCKKPISIKTQTGRGKSGFKLIWTVDWDKVSEFCESYRPFCDIIFVRINWYNAGSFYYIPVEVQKSVFGNLGCNNYLKFPKRGTNPRGVQISSKAFNEILEHDNTFEIQVQWDKNNLEFDAYKRWLDMWEDQ